MATTTADFANAFAVAPFAPGTHIRYAAWLKQEGDAEGALWHRTISKRLSEEGTRPGTLRVPAAWEARMVLSEPVAVWCDALKAYVAYHSRMTAEVPVPVPGHNIEDWDRGFREGYSIYPDGSLWHHHGVQDEVWADGLDCAERLWGKASCRPWAALGKTDRTLLEYYYGEDIRTKFPQG
jgi:hypothetical protein